MLKVIKTVSIRHVGTKVERKYSSNSFLTSALDGMSGQRHAPALLYPRKRTPIRPTHWIGDWVGLKRLDTEARGKILCL
jgi:hypothetical protein